MAYDDQGFLPAGLEQTVKIWSMPEQSQPQGVNQDWWLGIPVGRWNMTSFNYNEFEQKDAEHHIPLRFCALNTEDFDIDTKGQNKDHSLDGQRGDLFPHCYVRDSDASGLNRKFFEQAQKAQNLFVGGKLDAVSEINKVDPWRLQPCAADKTIFEVLLPVAMALIAGIATGELLEVAVPSDAPQAIRTVLTLGATAFGWEFGTAFGESDSLRRRSIFKTASDIAGVCIGSAAVLGGLYLVSNDWQSHEMLWLAGGGVGGYYVLSPLLLPKIDSFSTGLIGILWRFLNGIIGFIGGIVCGIANWDTDGCSAALNPQARTWDRTLLAAAQVEAMAHRFDLDDKQKEVAFQALLLNAASSNTYMDNYSRADDIANNDPERAWNGPLNAYGGSNKNAYSAFGTIVQANSADEENWMTKLSGGNAYPFFWTMFPKDEARTLLQKCATADELFSDPAMQKWASDAHIAAQNGKLQPYPVSVPKKTYNCDTIYMGFLQQKTWIDGMGWIDLERRMAGGDFAQICKKSNPVLYTLLHALAANVVSPSPVALVMNLEVYIATLPESERTAEFYRALLNSLQTWNFSSMIANDLEAQDIWRSWMQLAEGGVETACVAELAAIKVGDTNWKAVGERAKKFTGDPTSCTREQRGRLQTFQMFGEEAITTCQQAVLAMYNRLPIGDRQMECGVGEAFSYVTGMDCDERDRDHIKAWVEECAL